MSLTQLEAIKEILEDHRGKHNQISSGDIGQLIGIIEDATHVRVRNLIRQAITLYKIPIAGSHRGYYMIENEKELNEYCSNIDNRISKMDDRKNLIISNFNTYY